MIAVPKGWRRVRKGAMERIKDRYRFKREGGSSKLAAWSPIGEEQMLAKVTPFYITIRKIK